MQRKTILDKEGLKKLGFSKETLHYMKKNAEADKPFTLNAHVRERVNKWEMLVSKV